MPLTTNPDVDVRPRRFVPDDFDPADRSGLEALTNRLLERIELPLGTVDEFKAWLEDWSELATVVDGAVARRYIAMTRDTRDEDARRSYVEFERDVVPLWKTLDDRLNRQFLACDVRDQLDPHYAVFQRRKGQLAEIFREENTELKAREVELGARYDEIQGDVTVEFRGETLTAQQCAAYLEDLDRPTREESFKLLWQRRLRDRDAIDEVFEELLELRGRIARNAGFENFRDYRFRELCRFDYTPADCEAYHRAVEDIVVPVVGELVEVRKRHLGLDTLRPWDTRVNTTGRPPLKPFQDVEGFVRITRDLFAAVDPVFDRDFDVLARNDLLDLMSRSGKAPGGYNYAVEDIGLPFIFMSAVGLHDDVQTLLHEGGHAFHTLATRAEALVDYREAPIEFAEVASMSMELFGLDRIEKIYSPDDARQVRRQQIESILKSLCWFATIDSFQHWVYTHPGHSREERRQAWRDTFTRFAPHTDWESLEEIRQDFWQKQSHLFDSPFYYIEYAIAQIGALQAWGNYRRDDKAAVRAYREALALGGSRSLPELFRTAGLRFAMGEEIVREVVGMLTDELDALAEA